MVNLKERLLHGFRTSKLQHLRLHQLLWGGSFLLTVTSLLLKVCLCCSQKIGVVFLTYGELRSGLFLLTVEISLVFFCLWFPPPIWKLDLVFFAYRSPTVSKKDEP